MSTVEVNFSQRPEVNRQKTVILNHPSVERLRGREQVSTEEVRKQNQVFFWGTVRTRF